MRIKKKEILLSAVFFLFLMVSGTIVGYEYAIVFDPLFLFASLVFWAKYGKRIIRFNQQMKVTLFILGVYIFSCLLFFSSGANIKAYISYIIRIVGCYFLCSSINENKFEEVFSNAIFIEAIFSLLMFAYGQFFGIGIAHTIANRPVFIIYNFLGYTIKRNSGIFWEPGAHQFFLNLAIVYSIRNKKNVKAIFDIKIIVLFITVITTRSTSGYLCLLCIGVLILFKTWKTMSMTWRIVFVVPMIVLATVLVMNIMSSSTVVNKFSTENLSYTIRLNDFNQSVFAIKEKPLLGWGVETTEYEIMAAMRRIRANSVGFFCASIALGLPYAMFYLYRLIRYCFYNHKDIFLMLLITIMISVFTEDFFRYAIYFVLAIGPIEDKKRNEKVLQTNLV